MPEVGDGGVAGADPAEAVRTDQVAAEQQSEQAGNVQTLHQRRPEDHDAEQQEEFPRHALGRVDVEDRGRHHRVVLSSGTASTLMPSSEVPSQRSARASSSPLACSALICELTASRLLDP